MHFIILVFCLALNVASSVGLVAWSKNLSLEYRFPYAVTLALGGIAVVALVLNVLRQLHVVRGPVVPLSHVWPVAVSFSATVVLVELSILLNPISVHTSASVLLVPLTVWIVTAYGSQRANSDDVLRKRKALHVLLGLAVAATMSFVVCDSAYTLMGATTAVLSVVSACVYLFTLSSLQKEKGCTGVWLLTVQAPYALLLVGFVALVMDGAPSLTAMQSYACAWETIFMATGSMAVYHITAALILEVASVVAFAVLSAITFAIIAIVAHFKYGELLTSWTATCGFAAVACVAVFVLALARGRREVSLTECLQPRRGE